jgi:hypothetical protein
MVVSTANLAQERGLKPINSRLRLERIPHARHPDHIPNYDAEVRKRVETLVLGDIEQYRGVPKFGPNNELLYQGRSTFRVYRNLYLNGSKEYVSLGFNSFGGVTLNPERKDDLPRFYQALLRELLPYVTKQKYRGKKLRLVAGTGGGPGFPMGGSVALLRAMAQSQGIWGTHAIAYSILAKIDKETPAGIAHEDFTMRGQSDLGERCYGLGLPASTALFNWGGIGTGDEDSDTLLINQLFEANGPLTIRVVMGVLLDGKMNLTAEQKIARGQHPDHESRFYDFWDLKRRNAVECGLAKPGDFDAYIRVNVDEDPETRGREVGEDMIRWHQLRLEAGVQEREDHAIREALLGLDKKFSQLDKHKKLLTDLAALQQEFLPDDTTVDHAALGEKVATLLSDTPLADILGEVAGTILARHTHQMN